jgi:predicted DNA-binding protein with PD1-like motif
MKFAEARQGRVFVIRLEHGDVVHECIEQFAKEHDIRAAALIAVGGADKSSRLIVGPEDGEAAPVMPMETVLDDVHEISGTGTLFPDETGAPVVHMHMACGRGDNAVTGCIRKGVKVWHVQEIILFELLGTTGKRVHDPATGFALLQP